MTVADEDRMTLRTLTLDLEGTFDDWLLDEGEDYVESVDTVKAEDVVRITLTFASGAQFLVKLEPFAEE